MVLPGRQSSEEGGPRLFGQFSEEGPHGLASPPPKVNRTRRWEEAAGCAFLLLVLRTPPPRKAAVPLVNSLSLEAGLLAHCSENSLNCLPSKGKSSTEPPWGRVEVGHLV